MDCLYPLSKPCLFKKVDWNTVPDRPGVYVIYDLNEVIYVGMAGRNGKGCLRNRLRDHASGQIVNMFAQYLFLDRVQFTVEERIKHPKDAKIACKKYIMERLSFSFLIAEGASQAREYETHFKKTMKPSLNPH